MPLRVVYNFQEILDKNYAYLSSVLRNSFRIKYQINHQTKMFWIKTVKKSTKNSINNGSLHLIYTQRVDSIVDLAWYIFGGCGIRFKIKTFGLKLTYYFSASSLTSVYSFEFNSVCRQIIKSKKKTMTAKSFKFSIS